MRKQVHITETNHSRPYSKRSNVQVLLQNQFSDLSLWPYSTSQSRNSKSLKWQRLIWRQKHQQVHQNISYCCEEARINIGLREMFCHLQFHSYLCYYSWAASGHLKFPIHVTPVSDNTLRISELGSCSIKNFSGFIKRLWSFLYNASISLSPLSLKKKIHRIKNYSYLEHRRFYIVMM